MFTNLERFRIDGDEVRFEEAELMCRQAGKTTEIFFSEQTKTYDFFPSDNVDHPAVGMHFSSINEDDKARIKLTGAATIPCFQVIDEVQNSQ